MDDILREFVTLVIERKGDEEFIAKAQQSYADILEILKSLDGESSAAFSEVFEKEAGKYSLVDLNRHLPRPEHENLYLVFVDKKTSDKRKTISAEAYRSITPEGRLYWIELLIDVPYKSLKAYNSTFRKSVLAAFATPDIKKSYIHEFVHTLDFRRMSDEYLLKRSEMKRKKREAGIKKDFKKYVNDPLERNAYFFESLDSVIDELKIIQTREEWDEFTGGSPRAFIEIFVKSFLDPRAKKHWDDKAQRSMIKRLAAIYETYEEKLNSQLATNAKLFKDYESEFDNQ